MTKKWAVTVGPVVNYVALSGEVGMNVEDAVMGPFPFNDLQIMCFAVMFAITSEGVYVYKNRWGTRGHMSWEAFMRSLPAEISRVLYADKILQGADKEVVDAFEDIFLEL